MNFLILEITNADLDRAKDFLDSHESIPHGKRASFQNLAKTISLHPHFRVGKNIFRAGVGSHAVHWHRMIKASETRSEPYTQKSERIKYLNTVSFISAQGSNEEKFLKMLAKSLNYDIGVHLKRKASPYEARINFVEGHMTQRAYDRMVISIERRMGFRIPR